MITKEQMEAKDQAAKKVNFDRFMREPLTGAMLSIMPPSEHLEVLLRAAFESGFNAGNARGMINVFESIMPELKGKS
jgi:hypothetical protein